MSGTYHDYRWGTTYTYAPQSWVEEAACAQTDPELFFPEKGQPSALAKLVCRRCPVIAQCLEYAVNSPILLEGVWGGTSMKQRQELRRQRSVQTRNNFDACGTPAGARRHYRAKEVPCASCRRAEAVERAERRANARSGS